MTIYRSKILSDEAVRDFLEQPPEMFACFALPDWLFGPGDIGPASSGQFVLDDVQKKLPGVLPARFSVADARDVAEHEIMAMKRGRRGERYLAAGQHMTMGVLMRELAKVSNIPVPTEPIPLLMLRLLAQGYEIYHRLTQKPVLLSKSSVDLIAREYLRPHVSHRKSHRGLGRQFRSVEETLSDLLKWYRQHDFLPAN